MLVFHEDLPADEAIGTFDLKTLLRLNQWTILESSDGTTYNPAGDQISHGGTGAGGLDNALAWWLMLSPDGRLWISVQRGSGGSPNNYRLKVMRAAPTVGASATQTPATVSSNDEIVLLGGGTDAAPSFQALIGGAAGSTRVKAAVDDQDGRFFLAGFPDGGGNPNTALVVDRPAQLDTGDVFPWVVYCTGSNHFAASSMSGGLTNIVTFPPGGGGSGVTLSAVTRRGGANLVIPNGCAVDPITADNGVADIALGRRGSDGGNPCWKGVSTLMKWNCVTGSATGDTYSLSTVRDRIVIRDVNLPWTGNVPVNGAASTDRPASQHESLEADVTGLTIGINSSAKYLMQAFDSVTGDLYLWVANAPDFAGAGYPGPNSPTQVAVSAVKEG